MDFYIPLVLFSHEILKRCNHVIIIISFYIFLQMINNNVNKSYDQFGLNNYISLVVVLFIIVIILKLNAPLIYLQR